MFFQEIDLLEIRLRTLAPVVDVFGIVELDHTHSGRPKGYVLEPLLTDARFRDFPIRYLKLKVPSAVLALGPWGVEGWHRSRLRLLLDGCRGGEGVLVCDLDEIPHPTAATISETGRFGLDLYYFHLNTRLGPQQSKAYRVWADQALSGDLNVLRYERKGWRLLDDRGWHFSSVGTWEDVAVKMRSTSHVECGTQDGLAEMERYYHGLRSTHGERLEVVSDASLPPCVGEDRERFAHLLA